jgi:UDPglucose 6-dehydrogenase
MKIAVLGLWHLGSVTAGCLAHLGFTVTAIDEDSELIGRFRDGQTPVDEPGLPQMILEALSKKRINFTTDLQAVSDNEVVWVTYDTPVDDNDRANIGFIIQKVTSIFPYLSKNAVVVISSQVPVGTTSELQRLFDEEFPSMGVSFCYIPENLRLGTSLEVFLHPDRIIVGADTESARSVLERLLVRISQSIIWMKVSSAEMTKHAINAFLANSIVFINEIALLCERVGADASEVERGLKSEQRIGPKAYLKPGNAFAGGTLARDISYIIDQQEKYGLDHGFFSSVFHANLNHRNWIQLAASQFFPRISGIKVAVLGLTYKPGTNTLRRSQAVEFCKWANANGAFVKAFDPSVPKSSNPKEVRGVVELTSSSSEALQDSDLIVVATSWPEFAGVDFDAVVKNGVVVIDPNGFLESNFKDKPKYQYIRIGRKI